MNNPMQNRPLAPPPPPPTQLTVSDIYFVLFKHKWKIIFFSFLGLATAAGFYFLTPAPFQSEAKLLVRYVQDSKSLMASGPGADAQVKPLDLRGENIMSSEAEILSSLDVASAVVDIIGAEKIVGKGGITNREAAAVVLSKNLIVQVPKKGNVLNVAFQHTDPTIVQPVLRQVIDSYFKKHVEIHRNLGVLDEFLTQRTDQLRAKLAETEEELRKLKTKSRIVSLDESRKYLSEQNAKLRMDILSAEVELEERQAALKELARAYPSSGITIPALSTNAPIAAETNLVAASDSAAPAGTNALTVDTNLAAVAQTKPKLPSDLISGYKRLGSRLDAFFKKEQELLTQFTDESVLVKEVLASIADLERQKKEMESENPGLLMEETVVAQAPNVQRQEIKAAAPDFSAEQARVVAIAARIRMLNSQFEKMRTEASGVDEVENSLVQLQRKKELEESQYRYYSTSLEQARVDTTLGSGKLSNISEIQSPSLPLRDSKALKKKMAMAAGGGIGFGLGLAFLLELVLSQSIRRAGDLESKFQLPVFLTIPELATPRQRKRLGAGKNGSATNGHAEVNGVPALANGAETREEIAPWDEQHQLHPFSEALRDRLVTFFEMKGMTHKPKLIALTSCSEGAGVTTLAAGLAASLSETGEGNVLLVDMNLENGAAHPFYKGKPACGLADVLEIDKRSEAMVHKNLYVVNGGSQDDRLPRILPKRIAHLLPQLQASDYDYIIFDMPPINQTSVTPRLAGFMDMVFLVVEAEKTNSEWIAKASGMLLQSKANIGAVFNKRRTYTPSWLHQEF